MKPPRVLYRRGSCGFVYEDENGNRFRAKAEPLQEKKLSNRAGKALRAEIMNEALPLLLEGYSWNSAAYKVWVKRLIAKAPCPSLCAATLIRWAARLHLERNPASTKVRYLGYYATLWLEDRKSNKE